MRDEKLMSNNEIFAELEKQNIVTVTIEFSGGGDEGGCESIIAIDEDGKEVTWDESYGTYNSVTHSYDYTPEEKLRSSLCQPVYQKYGGFAFEGSVHGTLTWNVKDKIVRINGQESVESWDDFDEEVTD